MRDARGEPRGIGDRPGDHRPVRSSRCLRYRSGTLANAKPRQMGRCGFDSHPRHDLNHEGGRRPGEPKLTRCRRAREIGRDRWSRGIQLQVAHGRLGYGSPAPRRAEPLLVSVQSSRERTSVRSTQQSILKISPGTL
jgi:hypothetical protein